jgi:hypothetical protein
MRIRLIGSMGLLALGWGLAAGLQASGPAFWTVATAADFLRGRSEGAFVGLDGTVTAGPQLTNRLTSTPAQIWSLATSPDGTIWAGTGGDGRLIRVRPGQSEETVFDSSETNVFAVAVNGSRVYAATGPDGRVYVIDGAAAARPFFDPEEKYIWALAADAAGQLIVGAGSPAVIYRVASDGTGTPIYKPPAAHVVVLGRDASGRILAGTESPGRLYRLDPAGRPFVMLDTGLTELRAIALAPGGEIFAAGVARGDSGTPSGGETTSVAITLPPPAESGGAESSTATPPTRRSVVYRIDTAGAWDTVAETADVVYDLMATADGGVLAASGPEGRLYRISARREVSLHTGVDAKQITRFAAGTAGAPVFATANPGRIVSTGGSGQSPASFFSPVRDTKTVATWGVIRWEAGGSVELFTRSGNTEKPDDSWTDWTGPYRRREGEAVTSPAARFLQWKAVLTPAGGVTTPRLTSVTVAYLPRNGRPSIGSLTIHPPGVVFQRPFSAEDGAIAGLDEVTAEARRPPGDAGPPSPPPGRRMFQKGLQTIVWKAEDPDRDTLTYTLAYRREGDATWHDLRKGLLDEIFVWDTTAVADGRYVVRVIASDETSNAAGRAQADDRESDPIAVDNTAPVVTTEITRAAGGARLVVRVRDAQSPIQKVEYSLAGGAWQLLYPVDGLADSPDERYEVPLANEADAARLVIRATDLLQNVTSHAAGR